MVLKRNSCNPFIISLVLVLNWSNNSLELDKLFDSGSDMSEVLLQDLVRDLL